MFVIQQHDASSMHFDVGRGVDALLDRVLLAGDEIGGPAGDASTLTGTSGLLAAAEHVLDLVE
jgi:hypothetical protein